MLNVADEPLALGEVAKWGHLAAVRALWPIFLDPGAQAFFAGHFAAGGAHFGFLERLETNVAVEER